MTTDLTSIQPLKQPFYRQAGLVVILAALFGGLLAGAQILLTPVIEANKLNETITHIPSLLQAGPKNELSDHIEIERQLIKGTQKNWVVFRALEKGQPAGWAVLASGQGYAGNIELLIGLNGEASTITGIYVLNQMETPGLGNKIGELPWRRQFAGQATNRSLVVNAKAKGGQRTNNQKQHNTIDAITGATISSKAVCTIINRTVADLSEALHQERLIKTSAKHLMGDPK